MSGEVDSNTPSVVGTNRIAAQSIDPKKGEIVIKGSLDADKVATTIKLNETGKGFFQSIADEFQTVNLYISPEDPSKVEEERPINVNISHLAEKLGISKIRIHWARFCSFFSDKYSAQALVAKKVKELEQSQAEIQQKNLKAAESARQQQEALKAAEKENQNKQIRKEFATYLFPGTDERQQESIRNMVALLKTLPPHEVQEFLTKAIADKFGPYQQLELSDWTRDIIQHLLLQDHKLYSSFNPFLHQDSNLLLPILIAAQKNAWGNLLNNLQANIHSQTPKGGADDVMRFLRDNVQKMRVSIYDSVGTYCRTDVQMERVMTRLMRELVKDHLTQEQQLTILPNIHVSYEFMERALGYSYVSANKE